ncbi:MAG: dCTP deaminase [Candidatus Brennerbacteria bacterium]|nr:dCTP deaminase [Candidatus Brennerbacteria bacterium]
MLKPDHHIRKLAQGGMIAPFEEKLVREGVVSYGLSSFGYDVRLADEFKVFTNVYSAIVDPKNFDSRSFIEVKGSHCLIPPNSFILSRSYEYIKMPKNIFAICLGKSTYARCGLIVNVTPLEPGWEGHITMEISNTTPLPAKVYANEGIAQLIFLEGHEPPEVTYDSRKGKYQGQKGIQPPKI